MKQYGGGKFSLAACGALLLLLLLSPVKSVAKDVTFYATSAYRIYDVYAKIYVNGERVHSLVVDDVERGGVDRGASKLEGWKDAPNLTVTTEIIDGVEFTKYDVTCNSTDKVTAIFSFGAEKGDNCLYYWDGEWYDDFQIGVDYDDWDGDNDVVFSDEIPIADGCYYIFKGKSGYEEKTDGTDAAQTVKSRCWYFKIDMGGLYPFDEKGESADDMDGHPIHEYWHALDDLKNPRTTDEGVQYYYDPLHSRLYNTNTIEEEGDSIGFEWLWDMTEEERKAQRNELKRCGKWAYYLGWEQPKYGWYVTVQIPFDYNFKVYLHNFRVENEMVDYGYGKEAAWYYARNAEKKTAFAPYSDILWFRGGERIDLTSGVKRLSLHSDSNLGENELNEIYFIPEPRFTSYDLHVDYKPGGNNGHGDFYITMTGYPQPEVQVVKGGNVNTLSDDGWKDMTYYTFSADKDFGYPEDLDGHGTYLIKYVYYQDDSPKQSPYKSYKWDSETRPDKWEFHEIDLKNAKEKAYQREENGHDWYKNGWRSAKMELKEGDQVVYREYKGRKFTGNAEDAQYDLDIFGNPKKEEEDVSKRTKPVHEDGTYVLFYQSAGENTTKATRALDSEDRVQGKDVELRLVTRLGKACVADGTNQYLYIRTFSDANRSYRVPDGVKAYYATDYSAKTDKDGQNTESAQVKLTAIQDGIIPANTGVVLVYDGKSENLYIIDDDKSEDVWVALEDVDEDETKVTGPRPDGAPNGNEPYGQGVEGNGKGTNWLVAMFNDGTATAPITLDEDGNVAYRNYYLTRHNGELGFFRAKAEEANPSPTILRKAMLALPADVQKDSEFDTPAFPTSDVLGAKQIALVFEDSDETTTGIEKWRNGENEKMRNGENEKWSNGENEKMRNDNAIYDLFGRKVAEDSSFFILHSSLRPGLYIQNGKKIVIK